MEVKSNKNKNIPNPNNNPNNNNNKVIPRTALLAVKKSEMKLGHEKIHENFLLIFNIFPGLWGQQACYSSRSKLEEDYSFAPEEVLPSTSNWSYVFQQAKY